MSNATPTNLLHALQEAAQLSTRHIVITLGEEPKFNHTTQYKLIQKMLKALALAVSHAGVGISILKNRKADAVISYGFSTELLFLTYIFSLFQTKNVYLLIHHNIQQAHQEYGMNLLLKVYNFLGYRFIVNETSTVLHSLGFNPQQVARHVSLPHPVKSMDISPNLLGTKPTLMPRIGIIGKVRRGKRFTETVDQLVELKSKLKFSLLIGVDDPTAIGYGDVQEIELVNTSSHEKYLAALSSCDIIVLNYDKAQYFYRCSGVAADAIGTKTYIVCPNFPLISSQIQYPSPVGVLYDDETGLEAALKKALESVSVLKNSAFESHYIERSPLKLASVFDAMVDIHLNEH